MNEEEILKGLLKDYNENLIILAPALEKHNKIINRLREICTGDAYISAGAAGRSLYIYEIPEHIHLEVQNIRHLRLIKIPSNESRKT